MQLTRPIPAALLVLLAAIACSDDYTTPPTLVAAVSLGSPEAVLSVREPRLLVASFRDASGNPMSDVNATWSSSNNAVVTVDQEGHLFGVSLGGPVTITVTADGKTASTPITVVPGSIAITPGTATLALGTTRQLSGTPLDFEGTPINVAGGVTWASTNTSVATVGATTGLVTTVAAGSTVITATAAGRTTPFDLETGVPTALDGHWVGTGTTTETFPQTLPIAFDVAFGSVRSFSLTFSTGNNPCGVALAASSAGHAPVVNNMVQVTLNPPQHGGTTSGEVAGTFTSNSAMTATYTPINFGAYGCTVGSGVAAFGGTLQGGTITATRQ